MNTKHIHQIRTAIVAGAIVAGGLMTAACGTDTGATDAPAYAPVEARIYPPTDVPEVQYGATDEGAQRRAEHNENRLRRAGVTP